MLCTGPVRHSTGQYPMRRPVVGDPAVCHVQIECLKLPWDQRVFHAMEFISRLMSCTIFDSDNGRLLHFREERRRVA